MARTRCNRNSEITLDLQQDSYSLCFRLDVFKPVERTMGYAEDQTFGFGETTEEADDFGFIGKERVQRD